METVAAPTTQTGTVVLDRYELCERLGSGGFATVWLAHDRNLDREVAVKVIPIGPHPAAAARAQREALAAARLSHPSIVSLYEAGRDAGAVYLVSELVHGATLHEMLASGELSDRDVLRIGAAVCEALTHAHARGVVHRDVKPGNILIPEAAGHGIVAKLTDFGIARVTGDEALTETGDVIGTLAYMAPEQADGREATAASDLYSLALVIYEGLSGVNPIRRAGAAATARRVGTRLPPLRRLRRDLPRDVCGALDRAVLPDPAARGSIAELRETLLSGSADADDEPGTVEASRWDVASTGVVSLREATERFAHWGEADPDDGEWAVERPDTGGSPAQRRRWRRDPEADVWAPAPEEVPASEQSEHHLPARVRVPASGRAAAGALAAVCVGALLPFSDGGPALHTTAAAAVCGVVVALLPRLGWLAVAVGLIGWLASYGAPGVGLVVGVAALPVLLLTPRRPAWWTVPAVAVALGMAGVAGAFPVVAGQARSVAARAALGALGWWWLALAELVRHDRLLTGPAGPAAGSLHGAETGIGDVLSTGSIAIGGLWAAGAIALPLLVRGRHAALDLLAAVAWAGALALGTRAIAHGAHTPEPRGLVAAAALGALAAVVTGAFARTT